MRRYICKFHRKKKRSCHQRRFQRLRRFQRQRRRVYRGRRLLKRGREGSNEGEDGCDEEEDCSNEERDGTNEKLAQLTTVPGATLTIEGNSGSEGKPAVGNVSAQWKLYFRSTGRWNWWPSGHVTVMVWRLLSAHKYVFVCDWMSVLHVCFFFFKKWPSPSGWLP